MVNKTANSGVMCVFFVTLTFGGFDRKYMDLYTKSINNSNNQALKEKKRECLTQRKTKWTPMYKKAMANTF